MRYEILGFNQAKAVEANLDLTDLLLLNYIMYANSNPQMKHIAENDVAYVWLQHEKIRADLPILNIAEGTLKNRLLSLRKRGYINSISVANKTSRGTCTYYSLTGLTMSLINDEETTTRSFKNDEFKRPGNFKMTSNNILNNIDNELFDNILEKEKENIKEKESRNFPKGKIENNDICPFFEELWKLYPRKMGKSAVSKSALKEINKIGFDKMKQAIENYKSDIRKNRTTEQYILHGSTFFNGRYKDYLPGNYEGENESIHTGRYDKYAETI